MYKYIIKAMNFILNGFSVLSRSSRMEYSAKTKGVEEFRSELFSIGKSSISSDKNNFKNDRRNIGLDMRKAASKLVIE